MPVLSDHGERALSELVKGRVTDDLLSGIAAALALAILHPGHPPAVAIKIQGQDDVCAWPRR